MILLKMVSRGTEVYTATNTNAITATNVRAYIGSPFGNMEEFTDIELRNIQAESNGVTTTIEPVGWSWIDQPLVGAENGGLNVYAIIVPASLDDCYRKLIRNMNRILIE